MPLVFILALLSGELVFVLAFLGGSPVFLLALPLVAVAFLDALQLLARRSLSISLYGRLQWSMSVFPPLLRVTPCGSLGS